eukprot:m.78008 g.78008  ORF g.78008 m.78008 type:complete len:169 (+) comp50534_c0_seq1:310-816(+)
MATVCLTTDLNLLVARSSQLWPSFLRTCSSPHSFSLGMVASASAAMGDLSLDARATGPDASMSEPYHDHPSSQPAWSFPTAHSHFYGIPPHHPYFDPHHHTGLPVFNPSANKARQIRTTSNSSRGTAELLAECANVSIVRSPFLDLFVQSLAKSLSTSSRLLLFPDAV